MTATDGGPSRVERYWEQYRSTLGPAGDRPVGHAGALFFGTDPDRAHEIARLVLDGTKTATGRLLWALDVDGEGVGNGREPGARRRR